jgi:prepilin-type processing-associated H-X9-DG protein
VVIAIIAILAAILFPVFAKAREKARQASCLSNVRQLSTAFLAYLQDYDEVFPGYAAWEDVTWPSGASGKNYWQARIYPYVKNLQLFNCPSATSPPWTGGATPMTSIGYNTQLGTSYNYPFYVGYPLVMMADIRYPAQTAMLADTAGASSYVFLTAYDTSRWIPPRHNGGANIGYTDGHAKWISISVNSAGTPVQPTAAQGFYYRPDGTS